MKQDLDFSFSRGKRGEEESYRGRQKGSGQSVSMIVWLFGYCGIVFVVF